MQVSVRVCGNNHSLQYFTPFSGLDSNVYAFTLEKKSVPGNGAYRVAKTNRLLSAEEYLAAKGLETSKKPVLTLIPKTLVKTPFNKRPGRFGVEFMTPEQAMRRIEAMAPFTKRLDHKAKAPLGILNKKDDEMVAIGATYNSNKGSHHEMCSEEHRKMIKQGGDLDVTTRQPHFKGRERSPRRQPMIQIGSLAPYVEKEKAKGNKKKD